MAANLTRKQAIRAVEREARSSYGMPDAAVSCKKLTAKMQKCRFWGLTRADYREGNIGGHSGTAYVRRYSYGIDVRVVGFRRGGMP